MDYSWLKNGNVCHIKQSLIIALWLFCPLKMSTSIYHTTHRYKYEHVRYHHILE